MFVPYTLTQEEVDEIVQLQMGANRHYASTTVEEGILIQEKANAFWQRMGDKYKFQWRTAKMDGNKGARYILAEPSWKII